MPTFLFSPFFWVFSWIGRRYPKELIESGYGLFDSTVESGQAPLSREVNYVYNSRESNLS